VAIIEIEYPLDNLARKGGEDWKKAKEATRPL